MDRFWLASYPEGVPADIDLAAVPSLVHLMEDAFERYRGKVHCVFLGREIGYDEIDRASRALGAWLQSTGLARGARVAIMMPNVPQYFVAVCAILRAGYVVVNVNPMYTPRELRHQLVDSASEAIVVLQDFAHVLEKSLEGAAVKRVVLASGGDMLGAKGAVPEFNLPQATRWNDAIAEGESRRLERVALGHDDLAFLQYTGGTTGVSKGAMLVHRNVIANTLISEAWLAPALLKGGRPDPLHMLCALPLYHIFSLIVCLWLGMRVGATTLVIPDARDLDALVKAIGNRKLHVLPAVNTLFNTLVNHAGFRTLDFSGLRVSNGGGMAVQPAIAEKWLALTGCPICEGYGLTESTSGATCNRVDTDRYTGTIGFPMPCTEIAIRDDEGSDLPLGQAGEICIRGPQVMTGYWQRADETAKVMFADGFFRSGDVGVIDAQGLVKLVDRKKDMILVSGFNVYPNEIEAVVASHPGVLECAAIGVPDPGSGEAVKLFVVRRDPALTVETLLAHCRENLTGYKRPRSVEFRKDLPKTNVGKILRRALRDEELAKGPA